MYISAILILSSIYDDLNNINKDNYINSDCNFGIIRIPKKDIFCTDYGTYKKYCNHFSMPDEFIVLQEKGMNNEIIHTIKPSKMYEVDINNKKIIAEFYYTFKCDKLDSQSKLFLRIFPMKDPSPGEELLQIISAIIIILIITFMIITICHLSTINDFNTGYIMGSMSSNTSTNKKQYYCE